MTKEEAFKIFKQQRIKEKLEKLLNDSLGYGSAGKVQCLIE